MSIQTDKHALEQGHISQAYALERLQHYDLALKEVGRALELAPDSAEAHTCGAWILRQSGRFDDAEREARSALACDPLSASAHNVLACILWSQGKVLEAEKAFELATSGLSSDTSLYLTNYARMMLARARPREALELASRALSLSPSRSSSHEVKGEAYLALGEYEDSIAALHAALRLDPRNAPAHNTLGSAQLAQGDVQSAQESFREALRLKPGSTASQANFVTALQAQYPVYGRLLAFTLRRNSIKGRVSFLRASILAFVLLLLLPICLSLVIGSDMRMTDEIGNLWTPIFFLVFAVWLVALLGRRTLEPLFNLLLWLDKRNRPVVRFEASSATGTGFLLASVTSFVFYGVLLSVAGPDATATSLALGASAAGLVVVLLSGGMRGLGETAAALHRRISWANYGLLTVCLYALAAASAYDDLPYVDWVVWLLELSLGLYATLWVVRTLDSRRASTAARGHLVRTLLGLGGFGLIGAVVALGLGWGLYGAFMVGALLVVASPFITASKSLRRTNLYRRWVTEHGTVDAQKRIVIFLAGAYACLGAIILIAHYLLAG